MPVTKLTNRDHSGLPWSVSLERDKAIFTEEDSTALRRPFVAHYTEFKYPRWPGSLSVGKTHKKWPNGLKKCFKMEKAKVKKENVLEIWKLVSFSKEK